ncbi:flagellar protein FlaG [Paenibacillus popilliae]|uniref:Flagellar protein FlaG n=1 Tax=Paenibacillus popilliae TaxID=78057 RepID=A0ABY3AT38_PAEPP|nr:flagellar protein FlaG [Paenibacillus sp. SDF0028]TQR43734.1 flagellar protein FlaG [Paenibacillus sp. SDF0028]
MKIQGISNTLTTNEMPTRVDLSPPLQHVGTEYGVLKEKQKVLGLSVGEKAILDAINQVNKTLEGAPQRYEFKLHQTTGSMLIKIYNKETNELIREIPPEKIVELVAKLQQLVVGAIIDEKR